MIRGEDVEHNEDYDEDCVDDELWSDTVKVGVITTFETVALNELRWLYTLHPR